MHPRKIIDQYASGNHMNISCVYIIFIGVMCKINFSIQFT